MASRDCDPVFEPHQLRQQLAARNNGDLEAARLLHLGVLLVDRRAHHQRARSGDVGGIVSLVDAGAQRGQALGDRRKPEIRAADPVSQVQEDFGNSTHADPPNAREMNMLGTEEHFLIVLFRLTAQLSIEIRGYLRDEVR